MGILDGLSGKIAKHNQIKEKGAAFLFSCANKYEEGTFLNVHYKTLGTLYLNYCYYLFESINTPSYKHNIKKVNYEYMMKYMVSIITCELCNMKDVEPVLKKQKLNSNKFVEIVSRDCMFTPEEREIFLVLAANYKNEAELTRSSILLGYTKKYYEKAISSEISTEENIALAGSNTTLIKWFFDTHKILVQKI